MATTAEKVWAGSHRYGCKCDGKHEPGPGRSEGRYSDGSIGACSPDEPCSTASVEWNAVRASFAQAAALKPLGRIGSMLEELATAPLMGTDKDAIAHGLSALADAIREGRE